MITIQIPKKELLRQLPDKAGYALLQWLDSMPDYFVLEGMPFKTKEAQVLEKYPNIKHLFTGKEWEIFLTLYGRGKVTYTTLMYAMGLEDVEGFLPTSNIVQVHVKNVRKHIRDNNLPFRIVTLEANSYSQGAYKLIEMI